MYIDLGLIYKIICFVFFVGFVVVLFSGTGTDFKTRIKS